MIRFTKTMELSEMRLNIYLFVATPLCTWSSIYEANYSASKINRRKYSWNKLILFPSKDQLEKFIGKFIEEK